jgi:hypothetical protein
MNGRLFLLQAYWIPASYKGYNSMESLIPRMLCMFCRKIQEIMAED